MDSAFVVVAINACANLVIDILPIRMVHLKAKLSKKLHGRNMRIVLTVLQLIVIHLFLFSWKFADLITKFS
jgi:hypothetical protein